MQQMSVAQKVGLFSDLSQFSKFFFVLNFGYLFKHFTFLQGKISQKKTCD